ncbi:LAMI_0G07052g1_1 [Lachancea mirantina]|uniref:LAMI_0G07052g1_1 n=1 Tax=Lachancea mirantina TaxID=1230905 RepID=A0A1G4K9F1_9SACH|nr:LAMI_0G07052g1_1 [Lachancea mirantina]
MSKPQLSPQKEQEIASKILERAELARMTRQLKLELSKVATPKKNSRETSKNRSRLSPVKFGINKLPNEPPRVSPLKTPREDETWTKERHETHQSPLNSSRKPSTPPATRSRRQSTKIERTDADELPVPRTPRISSAENEVGADLLMYLATSPYAGKTPGYNSSIGGSNAKIRVPTTPSFSSQVKPHPSSPHSSFKVPSHAAAGISSSTGAQASQSHFNELVDTPTVALYMSPSPQKRKMSQGGLPSSSVGANLVVPGTPSQEFRSAHLLKTPNFNMGDYVHNLFSPSPRVTSGSHSDSKRD